MRTIFFFLFILLMALVVISNMSCTTSRSGCGTEKDVQRHDRKRFNAVVLKPGTIAKANEYREAKLISVVKTFKGNRCTFVSGNDTVTLYLYQRMKANQCYLIKNIFFS